MIKNIVTILSLINQIINMTTNLSIVSIGSEKTIQIYNINGTLYDTINHNEIINLPYNSYIIQLSNPLHTSFSDIFDLTNTFLGNFLLFVFAFILLMVFIQFLKMIKKHGID